MDWEKITTHENLCAMSSAELENTAAELRKAIIASVSRNGGHLASNLGCIELTLALHRVFDIKRSPIIFDVGHQSYAHKLLTGRGKLFKELRQCGGCSGFPNPDESEFDPAISGHAGNAVSIALGMGASRLLDNCSDKVIALVGDGALENGITFEAINGAKSGGKNLLLILNDNRMSISPTVGALSRRLSKVISGKLYNRTRSILRRSIIKHPRMLRIFRRLDDWFKAAMLPPSALFQSLGFRFFGPVDGHSIPELVAMLEKIKDLEGPLLLHVVTQKGKGASYAEDAPDIYHGVGQFEPDNGSMKDSGKGFSGVLGDWLCRKAQEDKRVIGVSAAMISGVGMEHFAEKFPDRCFDTGITEGHAAIFSAGMALGGKKPVCALYATFAQRALDCIYHDTVLGKVPVIFVFDRAGAVPDGPTHHGIYDLGFLRSLPGLTVMMPRNEKELDAMLDYAFEANVPAVIRYPRGGSGEKSLPPPEKIQYGKAEIICETPSGPVIWAAGAECGTAEKVISLLKKHNIDATLINARFISPVDRELALHFKDRLQITIEDHASGGLGSALTEVMAGIPHKAVLNFNWGDKVIGHGNIAELRREAGLDPESIAAKISEKIKEIS